MKEAMRTRSGLLGFTLLEVLVVMALLSLIMLAMNGALRNVGQSGTKIDERLERVDDYRVAVSLLRSVFGRISARKTAGEVPMGATPYLFDGAADSVAWVGVMPARYGVGGRSFFKLAVMESDLVLSYMPYRDDGVAPDWSRAESQVLMRGVTSLQLRYENSRQLPAAWSPDWTEIGFLPSRVGLTMQAAWGTPGELIIPMRQMSGGDGRRSSADQTVIGGT